MADESERLPELDASLAELVQAYRAETVREPAQVEAALQNVVARVGGGATAAAGLSVAAKLGLVTLAVAAVVGGGVIAWGPGDRESVAVTDVAEAPTPEEDPTPTRVSAATRGSDATPVAAPESDAVVLREPTTRTTSAPASSSRARKSPREPSATPAESAPTPIPVDEAPAEPSADADASTLRAELELLRAARSALRSGRAREALATIDRHRQTYPSSTLAEERDATEVSALCALGRVDDARRKAAAFERRFPRSTRDLLGDCEARP